MRISIYLFAAALPFLVGGCQSGGPSLESEVSSLFSEYDASDVPGAVVMVLHGNELLLNESFGLADVEAKEAVTASTNFRLASVTKQFTAVATLKLTVDGSLSLSTTLSDLFVGFPKYGAAVQIQHLLSHTSGLIDYEDIMPDSTTVPILDAQVLDLLRSEDSTYFAPGTQYRYSNSAYAVLAMIIEQVSGDSFSSFLREQIFAPVGMQNTVAFEQGISQVAHRAFGHSLVDGAFRRTDQSTTSSVLGDGGVYSSAYDLRKWYDALDSGNVLAPGLIAAATSAQPGTVHEEGVGYGYGWFVDELSGLKNVRHSGSTIGFRTDVERFPEVGLTVVVLTNRNEADAEGLAKEVAKLYLEQLRDS